MNSVQDTLKLIELGNKLRYARKILPAVPSLARGAPSCFGWVFRSAYELLSKVTVSPSQA